MQTGASTHDFHPELIGVEQLSLLVNASKSVIVQLSMDPLLEQIAAACTQLVDAEVGGVLVLNQDRSGIQHFLTAGSSNEVSTAPTSIGIDDLPCLTGETLRLDDVRKRPQAWLPQNFPEIGPLLAVPLLGKDKTVGITFVCNLPGRAPFSATAEDLLVAFAPLAAVAIENASRYATAGEQAIQGERRRIAQELHTTVAQTLFSIGLEAEAGLEQPLPENVRKLLKTIRHRAGCGSQQVRSAIFALKASHSEHDDALVQSIQRKVDAK